MENDGEKGKGGLTLRAVFVAIIITIFLAATSAYIALRLGAMPWPVIFAVICSGAILKALGAVGKATNVHEINVAQAGGSIGGVLASAAAFVIPGIWLLASKGNEIASMEPLSLALICVTGGILGIALSVPIRRVFIDEEKLPYATGTAGANILLAGDGGGRKARIVLFAGILAALFALARDFVHPAAFDVVLLAGAGLIIYLYPMPLAVGVGYILGKKISFDSWFLGCLIGWALLVPMLALSGWEVAAASELARNLGMGVLLGSGVGFLFAYVIPNAKKIFFASSGKHTYVALAASVPAFIALIIAGVPAPAAFLAVIAVWIVASIAARMTGETDIDPYEQFGIVAVITIAAIYGLAGSGAAVGAGALFAIALFVTVAAAIVGDIGFDYKSAKIIGTRAGDIVIVDVIAVLFAAASVPFILEVIRKSYSGMLFTSAMPATQAQLVASSISGFAYPNVFVIGFAIAFVLEALARTGKIKLPFSLMALGIGMFIGFLLSIPFALGGLLREYVKRRWPERQEDGIIAAAGLMGGEGIAGFAAAALIVYGVGASSVYYSLIAAFALLLLVSVWFARRK
ncbi:MAG: OPT/YSL family transporter [Candidatus Micrarchaeota archaeon]|nr:OPT/YSL family transporter [Candidatus Micrarchaeota archaeon]